MIGIFFNGRLGNQIFQFYFYLYLKSNHRDKIVFFVNPNHSYIGRYFDLGRYNLLLTKFASLFTRFIPDVFRFQNRYPQNFVGPREFDVENFTIFHGFFQSDWYMKNSKQKVEFRIKKKFQREFEGVFGDVFSNQRTIAVHIRRTDYLHYGKRDISLPIEYFRYQLESIPDLHTYKVIFLSDDIEYVKTKFPMQENYIFSCNSEIVDFQVIQHADIAIISNSSFAWWAAYLSPKKNRVIAPKNWLGFRIGREHPKGIMTDRFEWRDVLRQTAST